MHIMNALSLVISSYIGCFYLQTVLICPKYILFYLPTVSLILSSSFISFSCYFDVLFVILVLFMFTVNPISYDLLVKIYGACCSDGSLCFLFNFIYLSLFGNFVENFFWPKCIPCKIPCNRQRPRINLCYILVFFKI